MKLLSIHIPKTAGTTFWFHLKKNLREDSIYRDTGKTRIETPSANVFDEHNIIHSHFPLSKYNKALTDDVKLVTWVRNPVFRLISDYNFAKRYNDRNNPAHVDTVDNNLSFEEYCERKWARNKMSKFIDGYSLSRFDFIGVQEFFDEDIQAFGKVIGVKFKPLEKSRNVNSNKGYQNQMKEILDNKKLIKKIVRLNKRDMQLYEEVLEMRNQKSELPKFLTYTIMESKRWNRV